MSAIRFITYFTIYIKNSTSVFYLYSCSFLKSETAYMMSNTFMFIKAGFTKAVQTQKAMKNT